MYIIALVGLEGVGKTSIAHFLAEKYNTNYALEYGMWYCENILNGYYQNNVFSTNKSDYTKIIEGQKKIWEETIAKSRKVCFFDTEYIFTKYFIDKQFMNWNWIDQFVKEQEIDLFIYLQNEEITIKKNAFINIDNLKYENNILLNYYRKFVSSKMIIVKSEDYHSQQIQVKNIVEHYLNKNENKI